jgi:hypothetical protein
MFLIISKTSGGLPLVKLLPIVSLSPSFAIMSIGD